MKQFTVRLDAKTQKMLDDYCEAHETKLSDAFRALIKIGLKQVSSPDHIEAVKTEKKMLINENRAIRGSIESTLILRQLCEHFFKDKQILDSITEKTNAVLKGGWQIEE